MPKLQGEYPPYIWPGISLTNKNFLRHFISMPQGGLGELQGGYQPGTWLGINVANKKFFRHS